MADLADQAQEAIERLEATGLGRALLSGSAYELRPTGYCRWCDDPIDPGRTFCRPVDNACAEDYAKYQRNRR